MSGPSARTPFDFMQPRAEGWALVVLSVLVVSTSIWLGAIGAPLETDAAPQGIISFELARTAEGAHAVLESWDARAREAAMLLQGVDFLYLLVYPAWFSLATIRLARRLGPTLSRIGRGFAWAVLLAAPLDVVENFALLDQLASGPSQASAVLAWACAVPKFALVFAAALFLVIGGSATLIGKSSAATNEPPPSPSDSEPST